MQLSVNLKALHLQNPVMNASGTFGYGYEVEPYFSPSLLGGLVIKGTTVEPREGNPYPRMAETPGGMLNAVGLQNPGLAHIQKEILPLIQRYQIPIVVNLSGSTVRDYVRGASMLSGDSLVAAIELNISCPNVKEGGMSFGVSSISTSEVVAAVRKVYSGHLMVKLSPNVTDITEIAIAAQESGADSLSLINTVLGMAIDVHRRRPVLSTITGGLSGGAIKPIALRMVWQVCQKVKIPVIGIGGISNGEDAIEFLLAGATAIQVGTATFNNPRTAQQVIEGIKQYMKRHNIDDINKIIGGLRTLQ